jgi:hypothetical protein
MSFFLMFLREVAVLLLLLLLGMAFFLWVDPDGLLLRLPH